MKNLTLRQVLHECVAHLEDAGHEQNATMWLKLAGVVLEPVLQRWPLILARPKTGTPVPSMPYDREKLAEALMQVGYDPHDALARVDNCHTQLLSAKNEMECWKILINAPKHHIAQIIPWGP